MGIQQLRGFGVASATSIRAMWRAWWERRRHALTHRDCDACGANVPLVSGRMMYWRNGDEWSCAACAAKGEALKAQCEREDRIKQHMRDLAEKHEAMLRFEARHGIYRGLPAGEEVSHG